MIFFTKNPNLKKKKIISIFFCRGGWVGGGGVGGGWGGVDGLTEEPDEQI